MTDTTFSPMGYEAIQAWLGKEARVFIYGGAALTGTVVSTKGKFFTLRSEVTLANGELSVREALINLDHVASIARK
ncbi:MAG: hypothetical protein LHW56_01765 [Candidatus Cloacimonetes bacterium]|nr:hypothetical protein [Candidatus Cloacimonadota bacterium]MDY0171615.1 hypothetical protein [Candidatus Cloacimonadaceae bacterium]